jgi:hypothetical protein
MIISLVRISSETELLETRGKVCVLTYIDQLLAEECDVGAGPRRQHLQQRADLPRRGAFLSILLLHGQRVTAFRVCFGAARVALKTIS